MRLVDYFLVIVLWFLYAVGGIAAIMYGMYAVAGFLNNAGVIVFTDAHVSTITYILMFAMASGASRAARVALTAIYEAINPG